MSIPGSWQVVLDPPAVAGGFPSNRTPMALNNAAGGIMIDQKGLDWGDAQIEQYRADFRFGSLRIDYRVPNRKIQVPITFSDNMPGDGQGEIARGLLLEKVGQLQTHGGWLMRQRYNGLPMYADVVDAVLTLPDVWGETGGIEPNVILIIEVMPDFYGDEISLDTVTVGADGVLTGPLKQSGVNAIVEGDWGGRVEIVVTDASGQQQNSVLWGFRSTTYDSALTAELAYEAELLAPVIPAAVGSPPGAVGGEAVYHPGLSRVWNAILSTDIIGTGPMTHRGTYQVKARALAVPNQTPNANTVGSNVWFRLVWGIGPAVGVVINPFVQIPAMSNPTSGVDNWFIIDLGQININPAPIVGSPHRWEGQIQGMGAVGGEIPYIDQIWFQPLDDTAGYVSANPTSGALTEPIARDNFNETGSAILVAPVAPTLTVSFSGGNLGPGNYGYRVTAYNVYGETTAGPQATVTIAQLATPSQPTAAYDSSAGSLSAGTYGYIIVAKDAAGGHTLPSLQRSITTGGTGQVLVNWTSVPNAASYDVYGRTVSGELFMANVGTNSFVDTGALTPSGAQPGTNNTCQNCTIGISVPTISGALGYNQYGRLPSAEEFINTGTSASFTDVGSIIPTGGLPTSNTTGSLYLSGQVADLGTWATTGSFDFYIDTNEQVANRQSGGVDIAWGGAWSLIGGPTTDCQLQVDVTTTSSNGYGYPIRLETGEPVFNGIGSGYSGVVARWQDSLHWIAALFVSNVIQTYVGVWIANGGTPYLLNALAPVYISQINMYPNFHTVRMVVTSTGNVYLYVPDIGPQVILAGYDPVLATGGPLATGNMGIYDFADTGAVSPSSVRTFDNFYASAPTQDAVIYPNCSLDLRYDGMFRTDLTNTYYGPVGQVVGDLPRIPPSGVENNNVELFLRPSRGDLQGIPDAGGTDSFRVTVKYRPTFIHRI